MYTNSINNLSWIATLLPDDCPYCQRFLPRKAKQHPLRIGDKVALITHDPAFAWNLACSYFEAGRPMPARLCYHVAYRVYRYLINRATIPDMDLAKAYAVQEHPGRRDLPTRVPGGTQNSKLRFRPATTL